MILAPYIENHNRSSTLHCLRTDRHAQIQIPKGRKVLKFRRRGEHRQKARETHVAFVPTGSDILARPVKSIAPTALKSP